MTLHIVKLRSASGDLLEWEMYADSLSKAVMAAAELCPECEIVSVNRKGEWE